jgi:hypothetical protein
MKSIDQLTAILTMSRTKQPARSEGGRTSDASPSYSYEPRDSVDLRSIPDYNNSGRFEPSMRPESQCGPRDGSHLGGMLDLKA